MGNFISSSLGNIYIDFYYPTVYPKTFAINQSLTAERKQERLQYIWNQILNSKTDNVIVDITLSNYQISDEDVLNKFFEKMRGLKLRISVKLTHDDYSEEASIKLTKKMMETNNLEDEKHVWFSFRQ